MGEVIRFPVERRHRAMVDEITAAPIEYVMNQDGFFGARLRPDQANGTLHFFIAEWSGFDLSPQPVIPA